MPIILSLGTLHRKNLDCEHPKNSAGSSGSLGLLPKRRGRLSSSESENSHASGSPGFQLFPLARLNCLGTRGFLVGGAWGKGRGRLLSRNAEGSQLTGGEAWERCSRWLGPISVEIDHLLGRGPWRDGGGGSLQGRPIESKQAEATPSSCSRGSGKSSYDAFQSKILLASAILLPKT
jgi:hypothetical protein